MNEDKGNFKSVIDHTIGNDEMERCGKLAHAEGSFQKRTAGLQNNLKKATK